MPRFRVFLILCLAAGACLERGTTPTTPPVAVAAIEAFAADSALLLGHTLQLETRAVDSAGHVVVPARLLWKSLYPQWVTVDSTGLVAAIGGPASRYPIVVTAQPGGVDDTIVLNVAHHGDVKWRVALGSAPVLGGVAQGPDGTLYVLGAVDRAASEATLFAVSPRGVVQWQRRLTQVNDGNYPLVAANGMVFVAGQHIWAFQPDGSLAWALTVRPAEALPNLPEGHAAAVTADGRLFAAMGYDLLILETATGDTLWVGPRAGDAGWLVPPTVSADGRVLYAKNTGDSLYAMDAGTGAVHWQIADPLPNQPRWGTGPAVGNGRVLIPSMERLQETDTAGRLIGLTGATGFGISEPAIDPDGTIYVQKPRTIGLFAYRPIASLLWSSSAFRPRYVWYGGPALAIGGTLYAAALDGFYAVQVSATGAVVRWRYPPSPYDSLLFAGAPLIGSDGTVYSFTTCNAGAATFPCSDELFAFWEDKPVEPNSPWPMWRHDARRSGQAHQ